MAKRKSTIKKVIEHPATWIVGGAAALIGLAYALRPPRHQVYGTGGGLDYTQPGGGAGGSAWLDPKVPGVPSDFELKDPVKLQQAFNIVKDFYGPEIARNVEKMYRLETAHFTSGQYLRTGSPGMRAFTDTYPYQWSSLQNFWASNPNAKPIGFARYNKDGKIYSYLAFPMFYGLIVLAEILKMRGNKPGTWYSTRPEEQAKYEQKLVGITTKFT